jgi:hypothetical protein
MTYHFVEKELQFKEWTQVQLTQLLYCKVSDDVFRPMLWGHIEIFAPEDEDTRSFETTGTI